MDATKRALSSTTDSVKKFASLTNIPYIGNTLQSCGTMTMIIFVFSLMLFLSMFIYLNYEMNKKRRQDREVKTYIDTILKDDPNDKRRIEPINRSKYGNEFLNSFYVMSSYNSCCNGTYSNTTVSLETLSDVIRTGARFLDFEIFNKNGEPVIAVSNVNDSLYRKSSYNHITVSSALETIRNLALVGSGSCPNPSDPLFLHFRLKTRNERVCNKLAKEIYNTFRDRLVGYSDTRYLFESNERYSNTQDRGNIFIEPLSNFMGKVIILVNDEFGGYKKSYLLKMVTNVRSGTNILNMIDYNYLRNNSTKEDTISQNRPHASVVIPVKSSSNENYNVNYPIVTGCQFITMNFQEPDSNFLFYYDKFKTAGSAFMKRDASLCYTIPTGNVQDETTQEQSMGNEYQYESQIPVNGLDTIAV